MLVQRTPLPKLQLTILMMMQGAEPICNSVIFPFINQLIRETGVIHDDERKTGYYAGIIESIFFVAECATVLFWGWASDILGRRPILLLGPLGLTASMLTFGLSKSYAMIVLSRCAQGAFNGNIGVGKNSIAEITDETNLAEAWRFYPVIWATGSTLGPIIGGALSRPTDRWPETLRKFWLLREYAYFLPCAVVSLYTTFVFIFGSAYLKETLPSLVDKAGKQIDALESSPLLTENPTLIYGTQRRTSDRDNHNQTHPPTNLSKVAPIYTVLSSRRVLTCLTTHAFLSFSDQSYQVLFPLMYSTSISNGGLGLSPANIGTIMGIWGVCNGIFQMMVFAALLRRFGPRRMFHWTFSTYLVCVAAYPLMSFLAKGAGRIDGLVMTVMLVQLTAYSFGCMAYGCIQMYILNAAPSPETLSTTNGLAQIVSSITRSFGPSVSASLFALSQERQLFGGYMVYIVLVIIIFMGVQASSYLPLHVKGDGLEIQETIS